MSLKQEMCRSCGAPIYWVRNEKSGKPAPINAEPDQERGNIVIHRSRGNVYEVVSVGLSWFHDHGVPLYTNHFMTCPQRKMWSKSGYHAAKPTQRVPLEANEAPFKATQPASDPGYYPGPGTLLYCEGCRTLRDDAVRPVYTCSQCGGRWCEQHICEDGRGQFWCFGCRDTLLALHKEPADGSNEPLDFLELVNASVVNAETMRAAKAQQNSKEAR